MDQCLDYVNNLMTPFPIKAIANTRSCNNSFIPMQLASNINRFLGL